MITKGLQIYTKLPCCGFAIQAISSIKYAQDYECRVNELLSQRHPGFILASLC